MIAKKLLASALALAMTVSTFTFAINLRNANTLGVSSIMASAATSKNSFEWTELSDGTMELSTFIGSETEVVIPNSVNGKPVTSIGYNAFAKSYSTGKNVTSVKIPNTVTIIKGRAFLGTKITHIDIPDSVTAIDGYAFADCFELESVNIPNSVTSFGANSGRVFNYCKKLKSVSLPNNLTYCNLQECFWRCEALEEVKFPEGIKLINRYALRDCPNLKTVYIPKSVTEIQNYTFHNSNPEMVIKYEGSQEDWNKITIAKGGNTLVVENQVTIQHNSEIPAHVYNDYDYSSEDFEPSSEDESSEEESSSDIESSSEEESSSDVESSSEEEIVEAEEIIWSGEQSSSAQLKVPVDLKDWETVSVKVKFQGKDSAVRMQIDANLTKEPYYLSILPSAAIGNVTSYTCEIPTESKDSVKEINFQADDVITQVSLVGTKKGGSVHKHSYTSKVTTPATCTENGVMTYTCSCGNSYTEVIKATGHSFGAWTTTKAATCEADGVQTRTCAKCGEKETKVIPATGHKYVTTTVAPTTTDKGYDLHTCSVCGDSYKDNYTDPVQGQTKLPVQKLVAQKNGETQTIRFMATIKADDLTAANSGYIKVTNVTTGNVIYNKPITAGYNNYVKGGEKISAPEGSVFLMTSVLKGVNNGEKLTVEMYLDNYDLPRTATLTIKY